LRITRPRIAILDKADILAVRFVAQAEAVFRGKRLLVWCVVLGGKVAPGKRQIVELFLGVVENKRALFPVGISPASMKLGPSGTILGWM